MAELKPPETVVVMVVVPELPLSTLIVVGDALTVKLEGAGVTVRITVTISLMLPEIPSTLMVYLPATVDEPTAIVMVEVPAPVIEVGLKPTVTPDGCPDADKEMTELKPLITVLVITEVPELPCITETEVAEAVRPKPGAAIVLSRPLIRPLPFGLPQPVARS